MVGVRRDVDVLQRERASLRMLTVTSVFVLQTYHKKMICSRKHTYLRCSVPHALTHIYTHLAVDSVSKLNEQSHTQMLTHQAQELSIFLWFHPRLVYLQIFGSPSCGKTQNTSRTKEVRCRLCLHEVQWWVIHDLRLEDLVLIWPWWKQNAAPHSGKQHCIVSRFGFLTKEPLSTNNLG